MAAEVGWGACRAVPGTASDTLVYDKVGNMVNDGKGLAYKYDGLGRLREVRLTGESNRLKTAYRYNGLGMRITHAINMSAGTSDDDVTDSSDPVTYFAYDERWRVAGAWVSSANTTPSSSTPTERWIHHAAGFGGTGGSSYIDSVVLRDRDVVTSGGSASSTSDGGSDALEERIYVLQNWRADVVATVGRTGTLIEWMQYTAYGSAITNPPGNADFNGDGGLNGDDVEAFYLAYNAGLLSADVNNDGGVTGDDISAFNDIWEAAAYPSPGLCGITAIRIGYAGYQWDGSVNVGREYTGAMAGLYHVRHRVYDPEMGRWTRRDPIGYVDGPSLYEYVSSNPDYYVDPSGLDRIVADLGTPDSQQPKSRPVRMEAGTKPGRITGYTPRTPGIRLGGNRCLIIGVVFYCIGEQIGEKYIPDPITPHIPSSPNRKKSSWKSTPECQQPYRDKKSACSAPGIKGVNDNIGLPGSDERRKWCDVIAARELARHLACRNAIWDVSQKCRGGDWDADDSGKNHYGEFLERSIEPTRWICIMRLLCEAQS